MCLSFGRMSDKVVGIWEREPPIVAAVSVGFCLCLASTNFLQLFMAGIKCCVTMYNSWFKLQRNLKFAPLKVYSICTEYVFLCNCLTDLSRNYLASWTMLSRIVQLFNLQNSHNFQNNFSIIQNIGCVVQLFATLWKMHCMSYIRYA